ALERLEFEQRIDEEPIPLVSRDAPGRSMRRSDEAKLLEVRHDVADRGRAQLQSEIARQRPRADGLTVADIVFDEELEKLLRALAPGLFSRIDGVCNHCLILTDLRICSNPCGESVLYPLRLRHEASMARDAVKQPLDRVSDAQHASCTLPSRFDSPPPWQFVPRSRYKVARPASQHAKTSL